MALVQHCYEAQFSVQLGHVFKIPERTVATSKASQAQQIPRIRQFSSCECYGISHNELLEKPQHFAALITI